MKKNVIVDLRTSTLLGPLCKFFELLQDLDDCGYQVHLIGKNWTSNLTKAEHSNLLWDPNEHPKDIIENLILPSFKNIKYYKPKKYSFIDRVRILLPPFFTHNRIVHFDFVMLNLEEPDLMNYQKQQFSQLIESKSLLNLLRYFLFYSYYKFFRHLTVKPKSKGFRYKLSKEKNTQEVKKFIADNKKSNVKYILISVLWDENMKYEVKKDRLKGGPNGDDQEFELLKRYVKDLDDFARKTGKIKFILASKKAVDWENFLKSEFLDLRNFEDLNFTISQMIYISQELSDATINWPSTFSIWITNCANIVHLTWLNNKDTSMWARNDLNKKNINSLLKKINVI